MERTGTGNILVLNDNDCYLEAKPFDFEYMYVKDKMEFLFVVWKNCEIIWSITKSEIINEVPEEEFHSLGSTPYLFFRAITLFYDHQRLNA